MATTTLNTSPTVPPTTPPPVTPQGTPAVNSQGVNYLKPATPIAVPAYGSTITAGYAQGQSGTAKYDPNTGLPLQAPDANTGTTPQNGTQNPSTGTTGTNTGTPQLSDPTDRAALQASIDASNKAQQDFSNSILNIQNGATPLNPAEQAQVNGLQQQWQTLINQQINTNQNAQGSATASAYRGGGGVGSDIMNNISGVISAGTAKVASLQSQQAAEVAKLTQSLKDGDMNAIKTAYDSYTTAQKASQAALQKTIDDTTKAIGDAQAENDKQQQYQLDVQKFNQTTTSSDRDYAEKVKTDAFDRAYKMEDLALKKQANNIADQNNNLPVVPTTTGGKPNAQSQAAFLAALPGGPNGAIATGIKGLTDYTVLPTTFSTRSVGGGVSQRQQFVTLAKQYDPTYDENQAAARAQNLKDLASLKPGTIGYQKAAASTAIEHLTSYIDTMSKLPNTPVGVANWLDNKVTLNPTVQKTIAQAKSDAEGFGTEFAKYLTGNAPDVNSINEQKAGLSPNNSPYTTQGNVQSKLDLLTGKFQTLAEQQSTVMGKPVDATTLLGQSAVNQLSNLKNKGYTVSIPGVLYTDKDAWQQHGGGTRDQWNSAIDTLTQMGLPLTPDNILQVAQQQ